jgi:hypothetical protein
MPGFKSQAPPQILLIIGSIFILAAVFFVYTGKAKVRFHGWVYRAEEPGWFWFEVVLCFLCGVLLIGAFFCVAS